MRIEHDLLVKEITSEIELNSIVGSGGGSGLWETGASGVYNGVLDALGYNCALPGGFYGPNNPVSTGSGTCSGGYITVGGGSYGGMGGSGGGSGSGSSSGAANSSS